VGNLGGSAKIGLSVELAVRAISLGIVISSIALAFWKTILLSDYFNECRANEFAPRQTGIFRENLKAKVFRLWI